MNGTSQHRDGAAKLRIAFLTNEFVTEDDSYGGLANYLNRITKALLAQGHEVELFVSNRPRRQVIDHDGLRVERVPAMYPRWLLWLDRLTGRRFREPWGGAYGYLSGAYGLSRVLEERHAQRPFDAVHSTNCGAAGLFVRRMPGRRHLMRLSSDRALWMRASGVTFTLPVRAIIALENWSRRRADQVYTPSRWLAERCGANGVRVCYPPVFVETEARADVSHLQLPPRYLLHFGQIGSKKGSDTLAEALRIALEQEPGLRMVWAGVEAWEGEYDRCRTLGGPQFDAAVRYMGAMRKAELYGTVKGAVATVLPSTVDNLPNTVIESLVFDVPVIGSNGASIDELVEDGRSGTLVPIGDANALAAAMVQAWRGEAPWSNGRFHRPARLDELAPDRAARNLVALIRATGTAEQNAS